MECNKWEETGLLYVSGELSAPEASEYEKHLSICQACHSEHSQYASDKKQFFTADFLSEPTPEHLDRKIIGLCARPMFPTGIGLFSMTWVKRAVFSALVFSLGLGAGGYFTFAYFQSNSSARYAGTKAVVAPVTAAPADTLKLALDSAKKDLPSMPKTGMQQGKSPQGIITVDLKKE
jgi:anti-sigma factor RsiW